jgi:hypothetical protein
MTCYEPLSKNKINSQNYCSIDFQKETLFLRALKSICVCSAELSLFDFMIPKEEKKKKETVKCA